MRHSARWVKKDRSATGAHLQILFHLAARFKATAILHRLLKNKRTFILKYIFFTRKRAENFSLEISRCARAKLFPAAASIIMHSAQCSFVRTTVDVDNVRYYDLSTENIWIFNFVSRGNFTSQSPLNRLERRKKKDWDEPFDLSGQTGSLPLRARAVFFFSPSHRLATIILCAPGIFSLARVNARRRRRRSI